ncbi:MAG TPA: thioredoxin family protein [Candidatus Aquabacterium excrementipullorum]|nr:thioredoxin family protein [Candidatus Aquabacterium excrementipullorum]
MTTPSKDYTADAPPRDQVDATKGVQVLEFGTGWCGICAAAQPKIAAAFAQHAGIPHLKVEDGPGRPLGRSFKVKLWPTLIFLFDGQEVDRLVRPTDAQPIKQALERLALRAGAGADSA